MLKVIVVMPLFFCKAPHFQMKPNVGALLSKDLTHYLFQIKP
jgi:hypothetical protein